MRNDRQLLFGFLRMLLFVGVFAVALVVLDAKREHDASYQQTRIWHGAEIKGEGGWTSVSVEVIDTADVCVYVARGWMGNPVAITAVPKTQLHRGAGCQ